MYVSRQISSSKMGHDMVFYDAEGNQIEIFSTKWLRDFGPREIYWDTEYFGKSRLSSEDLRAYAVLLENFIEDMELDYPQFPIESFRDIQADDPENPEKYEPLIARFSAAMARHADLQELTEDINLMHEILMMTNCDHIRYGFSDELLLKLWQFRDTLEAGLTMKSPDGLKQVYQDIYEIIENFINFLKTALS